MKPDSERGYTTVELIIAIQLTLVVTSMAYVGYLFSRRLLDKWEEKNGLETRLVLTSETLSKEIDGLTRLILAEEDKLCGLKMTGDTLTILIGDDIWVNHHRMFANAGTRASGKFSYWVVDERTAGQPVFRTLGSVEHQRLGRIAAVEVELIFTKGGREYPLTLFQRLLHTRPVTGS